MAIGDIGQDLFKYLSSRAKMTCNPSIDDKHGWDFIVEFSISNESDTYDKKNNHYKCLIQVKTTQKGNLSVPIKLSNWDKMINHLLPFYIFLVVLDENEETKSIYLSEVDLKRMEKVLRTLRNNVDPKLHNHDIYYSPEIDEKLDEISGLEIKERIIKSIGRDPLSYPEKKKQLLETLGYSEYSNKLFFNVEQDLTKIINFSLGLEEKLDVRDIALHEDIRFGKPSNIRHFDNGYLNITPQYKKVKIKFRNKLLCVNLVGNLYRPDTIISELPKELLKFRLTFEYGDILIEPLKENVIFNFNFNFSEKKQTLDDLINISNLILIISDFTNESYLEIYDNYDIFLERIVILNTTKEQINILDDIKEYASVIHNTYFIYKNLGLETDNIINPEELYNYRYRILQIRAFLDVRFEGVFRYSFSIEDNETILDPEIYVAIPAFITFKEGKNVIYLSGLYIGKPLKYDDDGYAYHTYPSLKFINLEIQNSFDKNYFISEKKRIMKEYGDDYNLIDFKEGFDEK